MGLVGVVQIIGVADGTGTLAAKERFLALPSGWTLVDYPNTSLNPGPDGQGGTGFLQIVPPASVGGTSLSISGNAVIGGTAIIEGTLTAVSPIALGIYGQELIAAGPFQEFVTTGGPAATVFLAQPPNVAVIEVRATVSLWLPSPGLLLHSHLCMVGTFAQPNSNGATNLCGTQTDTTRTDIEAPWVSNMFTFTTLGVRAEFSASALVIPAWASGQSYLGSLLGGTSLPNGVMGSLGNTIVSTGGHYYVCTQGGTSGVGDQPTGTGSGAINTSDGLQWYYVGLVSGGLSYLLTVNEIKVGNG